jgi:hypothetical protein
MSRHHVAIAHHWIIGALLFASVFLLLALDPSITGKASSGNAATTVMIVNSSPANCTFSAQEGYNIVSIPCLSTATPVYAITNGTPVYAIYQYVPGDTDGWRVYNPGLPGYVVNDLQFMTRRVGYIAYMNGTANRSIEGLRVESTNIPLSAGWNLVGYPSNDTVNSSTAFAGINATLRIAVAYNKSSERFTNYTPGGAGDLQEIAPGMGIWINTTAAATWTVLS